MLKKAKAEAHAQAAGESGSGGDFTQGIRDSSRQIWLAGLGAFARAQAEGMKMFEALVEQGQSLESRTRRAASDTANAAAGMAAQKAKEMQAMAGGTWDKLEQVFEERVARALSKLGVHTQADVERLSRRVEALSEAVNELVKSGERGNARPTRGASAPRKRAAKRAPSKAAAAAASAEKAPARRRSRKKPG